MDECAEIMNIPRTTVYRALIEFNIEKTKEKARESRQNYCQKIYGCDHPMQNKEVQEKVKATNLKEYGSEYIGGSKIIQERIQKTNMERYGVASTLQCPEIVDQIHQTNMKRYGCISPFGSKEVQEKSRQSMIELYGAPYTMSEGSSLKPLVQATNMELYGSVTPFGNPEIQERNKAHFREAYGGDPPFASQEIRDRAKENCIKMYGVVYPQQKNHPDWLKPATYDDDYLRSLVADVNDYSELVKKYPDHYEAINYMLERLGMSFTPNYLRSTGSYGEQRIQAYLVDHNIPHKREYTFEDLVNPATNCKLRYDFAIFRNSDDEPPIVIIEYDGAQHFYPVEAWGGEEMLQDTQFWDE